MAQGIISSLIAGLGAPLAQGLIQRYLVQPGLLEKEAELQRQKQVDNPLSYQQKGFDLVGSLAPGNPVDQTTGAPNYNFWNQAMKIPGFEGTKDYQQLAGGASINTLMGPQAEAQREHAKLFGAQTQKTAAETKEIGALTPARINLMGAQAFHAAAAGHLSNEQATELAGTLASKQSLQQSQADLAQAQANYLKSGDKSQWLTKAMDHTMKMQEELIKSPLFMMGKPEEIRSQKAREISGNAVSGMLQMFNKDQNITAPKSGNYSGGPSTWTAPTIRPR